ncbi:MAG: adenosine deaminase [Candidatus Zhuqueibacterota bacterium]
MKQEAAAIIAAMPKVELHLHLEGAFTFDFLFDLIEKYGGDPSVKNRRDLEQRFVFRDFPHFIETWIWKNRYFRAPEDFENSTYHTLRQLHEHHVLYVEAYYSPWDFSGNGVAVEAITEANLSAIRRARSDFGIGCALIADINRDLGWETGIERLKQIIPFRQAGVIGIGLGGSEQSFPAEPFQQVYRRAKELGFHRVAHAGEAAGPESVWAAIESLHVERIGHGVRAAEDAKLIDYLRESQLPLEVCAGSNMKTGVYKTLRDHPAKFLFEQGLCVTIHSDDPAMFGAWITDEFSMLHKGLDFSLEDIRRLSLNSANAAFLSPGDKAQLIARMNQFWEPLQHQPA